MKILLFGGREDAASLYVTVTLSIAPTPSNKQPHPFQIQIQCCHSTIQPCPPTPTPTYDICFRHPPWRDSFFSPSRTANQSHIFRLGSNLRAKSSDKRIAKCRASSSSNYYAYPDSTTSICCHLPHLRCLPPNC